jgi:phage protein D
LPAITLTRQDGWSWSCRQADRTQYDGAEAQWHDPATGQRRTHKTGGTNRKRLKRTYASQAEAQQAATAEAARRARSKRTFTYELAMANMQLQPNAPITLAGWTTAIDAASWLVESVETHGRKWPETAHRVAEQIAPDARFCLFRDYILASHGRHRIAPISRDLRGLAAKSSA